MRSNRGFATALALTATAIVLLSLGELSVGSAATPCPAASPSGHQTVTLTVDGRRRSAVVHVPTRASGRRVPLVLALHGYGGSGPRMEPYSGFDKLADRDTFIVAYPSSSYIYWNSTAVRKLPNDVHFLSTLIGYLKRTFCVDSARVFATGISNGGSMVALAACQLSGQIAAAAPVAGDYSRQPPCRPQRPVSVLEIHGTNDQVVPYFGPSRRRTPDGLPPYVNGWVHRDACATKPSVRHPATRTTAYRWRGCAGGSMLEHIKIERGTHQWPGAKPPDPGPPSTICASCTIWSFFSGLNTSARVFAGNGGAGLP